MSLRALIAAPGSDAFRDVVEAVRRACRARETEAFRLEDEVGPADFFRELEPELEVTDLVIADLSPDLYPFAANPIVELQVECARRLEKPVLVLETTGSGARRWARLDRAIGLELDRIREDRRAREIDSIPERVTNSIGIELVLVRPGEFTMGDPREDDNPPRPVRITRPFHLGRYPVTNQEYAAFRPDHSSGSHDDYFLTAPTQPVVGVCWEDARAFCEWLSAREGKRYRLPTEAEWEYACRAGRSTEASRYPWGPDWPPPPAAGNYGLSKGAADPFPVTSPVGRFPENPWGLGDLGGNVWEWCADWYGDLDPTGAVDPAGPEDGDRRVLKGAAWSAEEPDDLRTSWRETLAPDETDADVGFRVLCEPDREPNQEGWR